MGRKEERRQTRRAKKERRDLFYKRKRGPSKGSTSGDAPREEIKKKGKVSSGYGIKSEVARSLKVAGETAAERWRKSASKLSKQEAQIANEKEDKELKRLEKKLGIKRNRKSIPNVFKEDGFDFLLEATEIRSEEEEEEEDASSDEDDDVPPSKRAVTFAEDNEDSSDRENSDEEEKVAVPSAAKYIPPPARKMERSSADLKKLQRQVRGLVNRTAETNVKSIAIEIEKLYREHSRNDVNETFTSSLLSACISPSRIGDQILMNNVLLLSIVHTFVGMEVGAFFLEQLAKETHKSLLDPLRQESKQSANATLVFSHLYNLGLIHCHLIYDLVRTFVSSFEETDIELLLLLLRAVGPDLRRDDPHALKDIVVEIQRRTAAMPNDLREQSRVQFMLETISALRNNNSRKITGYDPDKAERYRHVFRGSIKGRSQPSEMKISFNDLVEADKKGRWWIVGSSWRTEPVEKQQPMESDVAFGDAQLLSLANQQRMSSDVRRQLFCVLMSSDDYVDAFEKLVKLKLKDKQGREIIHVIVDCCLSERNFNPFYGFLSQKFCEFSRTYQITFQYAVWDKLKALSDLEEFSRRNLARLLIHLFVSKALSLSILKIVDFASLEDASLAFFQSLIRSMLLENKAASCLPVFSRLAGVPELEHLKDGLIVFMRHFVISKSEQESKLTKLIKKAENALKGKDT